MRDLETLLAIQEQKDAEASQARKIAREACKVADEKSTEAANFSRWLYQGLVEEQSHDDG